MRKQTMEQEYLDTLDALHDYLIEFIKGLFR